MENAVRKFYETVKKILTKDSDLPNFFAYFITIEQDNKFASIAQIKQCYEDCDLHSPSWLASHFSVGLRSKPRRFVRTEGGYRLENKLRETIAESLAAFSTSNNDETSIELAGIEYSGMAGSSKECKNAILRLLQFGDVISAARLLSNANSHCIILTINNGDLLAVKSGFSSGYIGEGPRTLSIVLSLLHARKVEISEFDVDETFLQRVDSSALTVADLGFLDSAKSVRPSRWADYILNDDYKKGEEGHLWGELPTIMPLSIIDIRVIDLALSFWDDPDHKILQGYRRLEDVVRNRVGGNEHGSRLFSQAFVGQKAKLRWENVDENECLSRGNLFTAAFGAHRNPRAHRELKSTATEQLSEFLVLNYLYFLERTAAFSEAN